MGMATLVKKIEIGFITRRNCWHKLIFCKSNFWMEAVKNGRSYLDHGTL